MNAVRYQDIRRRFSEIREWKYLGLYDKEIADRLGVSPKTLSNWKSMHEEFRDLLQGANRYMVKLLKESILKAAIGYEYTEESLEAVIDPNNPEIQKVKRQKITRKWFAPNITAAIFLLCNLDHSFRRTDLDEKIEKMPEIAIIDDIQ